MNAKWQELDLGGKGLQAANLRLARTLRRRATAWRLLLLFPSGAHCWYLHERGNAAAYPALTLAVIGGWAASMPYVVLSALLALAILLIRDVTTLETRIAAYNKRQRMAVYLSQGAAAPAGFRGRFDEPAGAGDDAAPQRMPGFAEQEALLREIAKRTSRTGDKPQ